MKILLTGPRGFLGARIMESMQVVPSESLRGKSLDDIKRYLDTVAPDAIVHTAAISDIGTCEKNPEASYQANVLLPVYLAQAGAGCKMVMLSTDQVYTASSKPGPFSEGDEGMPSNTYARHKLEMEQRVLDIAPDAVMLRATWLYDMPLYSGDNRGNFLMNTILAAIKGQPVHVSRQQYRGITYAREAAAMMPQALQLPGGAYNFGSETTLNMFDTAAALLKALGSHAQVVEAPGKDNLWMDGGKARHYGVAFSDTLAGLHRCLEDYNFIKNM